MAQGTLYTIGILLAGACLLGEEEERKERKDSSPNEHILPQCTHGANDEAAVDHTAKYHLCIVHKSVP